MLESSSSKLNIIMADSINTVIKTLFFLWPEKSQYINARLFLKFR